MSYYDIFDLYDDDEDRRINYVEHGRKAGHPLGAGYPHIPNKQEAKEMRRLQAKSGQSKEEVRMSLSNRQKLAKAAKSPMVGNSEKRKLFELKRIIRHVANRLNLPTWHKDVQAEIIKYYPNTRGTNGRF